MYRCHNIPLGGPRVQWPLTYNMSSHMPLQVACLTIRLCHKYYRQMVSRLHGRLHACLNSSHIESIYRKYHICMAFRQYELAYVFSNQLIDKMPCHKHHKQMVSFLYEFVYGLLIWTDFECLFHRFHT